jgi:hypothetical protein
MGADVGGAVDLFVDEDVPADMVAESSPVRDQRTVVVRSGEVAIDGIEHFATEGQSTDLPSRGQIPNGTYLTKIRVTKNEDELPEPKSEKEIRRLLGADNVVFHEKTNLKTLLIGLSTLLLLPILLFVVRWYVAVPVTLVVFIGYFHVAQWWLKRNPRFQKVDAQIGAMRLAGERPIVIIQLSNWSGALAGGPPLVLPER